MVIPTYRTGPLEKNPLFIEKRAYQGSTGKVYPVPICEKISEEKEDVTYKAVILENDWLYVMILPELEVYQDDIQKRSDAYCRRLMALGHQGLAGSAE